MIDRQRSGSAKNERTQTREIEQGDLMPDGSKPAGHLRATTAWHAVESLRRPGMPEGRWTSPAQSA